MPRKAAALLRASTNAQAGADKYGLDVQRRAIRQYAESNDLEIVGEYSDIESGASEVRTNFYKLLSEAANFESVVFFDLTRLARTERLAHEYLHLLSQSGLELHATNRGVIEAGLYTSLDMAISAEERRTITRRLHGGVLVRADKHKIPPQGTNLWGYQNVPKALPVIKPEEAAHVRRLYQIAGESESWREIARRAVGEGVATPSGVGTWAHNNVKRTITNPAYKGELIWPRGTKGPTKTAPRTIAIPAIVSADVWQRAQKPKGVGRLPGHQTALSGHLKCGVCGYGFSASIHHNKMLPDRLYYRCNSRGRIEGRCNLPMIRSQDFEEAVEKELRHALQDEGELLRLFREAEASRAPDPAFVRLREKEQSFVQAFAKGDLTADEFGLLRRQVKSEMAGFDKAEGIESYPLEAY